VNPHSRELLLIPMGRRIAFIYLRMVICLNAALKKVFGDSIGNNIEIRST
jgi:hypothetical protein